MSRALHHQTIMNDTLLGVLAGGLIGWIAPLLTLRYSERRWKTEALIALFQAERERMESMYESALKSFATGAAENNYSSNMTADFMVLMPKEIGDLYIAHMKDCEKSDQKTKGTYLDLAAAMKRDLKARDEAIKSLLKQ
jgi:gas vesicle protein